MGIKTVAIHSDVDASSVSIYMLYLIRTLFCSNKKKERDVVFFLPWPEKGIHTIKKKIYLISHTLFKQKGSIMSSVYVLTICFSA